ncbi:MAG: hypothetical protein KGN76_13735, partial [Acidobacteriota bacterium]|nr:hypothetical protein [Acidobacteriota bacterium]
MLRSAVRWTGAVALAAALAFSAVAAQPSSAGPGLRFEVSFPSSVHATPIDGRVFVILSKTATP